MAHDNSLDLTHAPLEKISTAGAHTELINSYAGAGSLQWIKAINSQQAGDVSKFGLDPDPFKKDYHSPDEGFFGKAWEGIKSLVGAETTVEDKLREQALQNLTPAERKEYDQEAAARRAWDSQLMLNPGPRPDMPMHDRLDRAVTAREEQLQQQVLNSMTPEQRQQLAREKQEYMQAVSDAYSGFNPRLDIVAMPKMPEKGPTMVYFESQVQRLAERQINSHSR